MVWNMRGMEEKGWRTKTRGGEKNPLNISGCID